MTDISVLGTGIMGTAIADCLIKSGKSVTVWNRTREKTKTLEDGGASVAETAAMALAASPVSIFVVAGYDTVWDILSSSQLELNSIDIVNMTTGKPAEATSLAEQVEGRGGRLLEACILTYPSEIGKAGAPLYYSGPTDIWKRHSATLNALGGKTSYLGDGIQLANVMDAAVLGAYLPAITSILEAAAFAASHGLAFAAVEEPIIDTMRLIDDFIRNSRKAVEDSDYTVKDASLSVYHAGVVGVVEAMGESGLGAEMARACQAAMRRGLDDGHGDEDLYVLFDVLRAKKN